MSESKGVSYPSINSTELVTLKIAVPSLKEQNEIIQFINSETAIINTTIAKIEKEIALVKEYKTALIAEAVTGKIDVRNYELLEMDYEEAGDEELGLVAEELDDYQTEDAE